MGDVLSTISALPVAPQAPAALPAGAGEIADLLVAYLEVLGVRHVFGVPGGAIEPLYNALARSGRRGGPDPVVARHEAGAAFMADGYARNAGKLGVCCATTGPGATNLITGVASAYENGVPLLVITGQTPLARFGRKALQESTDTGVNTVGMFAHCTAYNTLVSHVDQFEHKLVTALMTALKVDCPVHLSVPLDVFRHPLAAVRPSYDILQLTQPARLRDEEAIRQLIACLEAAQRVVFVLGGGCVDAVPVILRVADRLGARVVTTPDGKGLISPYHSLYSGVIGFAGHRSAERLLLDERLDAVVAVGTTLGEWSSNGWDDKAILNQRLIHVEPLESNLTRSPMARLHVRGSLLSIFQATDQRLEAVGIQRPGWRLEDDAVESTPGPGKRFGRAPAFISAAEVDNPLDGPVKPQWLMGELTRKFPPHTRYLADAGNGMAWAIHYLHPFDRRLQERRHGGRGEGLGEGRPAGRRGRSPGLFQVAMEFASMGWAIAASVGAALARRDQPVVCITGDGSLLMSGQEMTVALQHRLPIVYLILNDGALGMVKHGQRLARAEAVGFELPPIDFAAMARAMGVRGFRISCPADLEALDVEALLAGDGPVLLDVKIDPEEVPPIALRVSVLND